LQSAFAKLGKQVAADTGLYYFNARWYDSELERFVTEDPARDGTNWYEYCGNNPLVRIDPTGNEDYNSSITQEQYGKSFYLQRQYDWNEVQDFFKSNPEGVLHRYPETVGFIELSSKNEIVDMNEPGAELVQLIAGGKVSGLFKGLQSLFERVGNKGADVSASDTGGSLVTGVPEGGAYSKVPANGGQKHHMPADSVSPLPTSKGPVVNMSTEDHMQTASWGSSRSAKRYRAQQKGLIDSGNFMEAQKMDIDDVKSKFGNKYDEGIDQMLNYTKELKDQGVIQ
jgi:RHS repeat-associated protein